MQRFNRRDVSAFLGAGILSAFAIKAGAAGTDPMGASHQVGIRRSAYDPEIISIKAGDTVVWTNHDIVPHTASDLDIEWDTGSLARGESGSITFEAAGTYEYFCIFHPHMTGKVMVQA